MNVNLVNLAYWFENSKKYSFFSDWLNLNQVVKDEMKGQSLRDLAHWGEGDHNPVYSDLLIHFKQSFLVMSQQDEKSLAEHIQTFKILKQKYVLLDAMMSTLQLQNDKWKVAC